jgi:hypothetical protein
MRDTSGKGDSHALDGIGGDLTVKDDASFLKNMRTKTLYLILEKSLQLREFASLNTEARSEHDAQMLLVL